MLEYFPNQRKAYNIYFSVRSEMAIYNVTYEKIGSLKQQCTLKALNDRHVQCK